MFIRKERRINPAVLPGNKFEHEHHNLFGENIKGLEQFSNKNSESKSSGNTSSKKVSKKSNDQNFKTEKKNKNEKKNKL